MVRDEPHIRAFYGVPLQVGTHCIGAFCVADTKYRGGVKRESILALKNLRRYVCDHLRRNLIRLEMDDIIRASAEEASEWQRSFQQTLRTHQKTRRHSKDEPSSTHQTSRRRSKLQPSSTHQKSRWRSPRAPSSPTWQKYAPRSPPPPTIPEDRPLCRKLDPVHVEVSFMSWEPQKEVRHVHVVQQICRTWRFLVLELPTWIHFVWETAHFAASDYVSWQFFFGFTVQEGLC